MIRVYLAGPLFTSADRIWNLNFYSALIQQRDIDAVLPQLVGDPIQERKLIRSCDVVVARLDGPDADSGTAWEMGYAFATARPVYYFRTDYRQGGPGSDEGNVNLMLSKHAVRIPTGDSQYSSPTEVAEQVIQTLQKDFQLGEADG